MEFINNVKSGKVSMDPIKNKEIEIGPDGFGAEEMQKLEYHALLKKNAFGPALASPAREQETPVQDTIFTPLSDNVKERIAENAKPSKPMLEPAYRVVGEIFQLYYIVEHGDQVIFIDKHAAHEKIIYNDLLKTVESQPHIAAQILLTPVVISLSAEEMELTLRHLDDFIKVGMDLNEFGPNQIAVKTLPQYLPTNEVSEVFFDILQTISEKKSGKFTDYQEKFFRMIACRSAIKAGQDTSPEEIAPLVHRILQDENLRFCPHGRPIYLIRSKKEFDKLFKRIV